MTIQLTDMTLVVSFWLVFTRMLVIIIQLPMFDNESVPMIIKILAVTVISFALYPTVSKPVIADINSVGLDNFWWLTVFYTVVGIVIGFLVKVIMDLYISAGSLITQQVGFSAISYFDPSAGAQVGPFEQLIRWTIVIMIISSGAMLPMFKGIVNSFFTITISDISRFSVSPEYYIDLFKSLFTSSLMLASPLIFTNVMLMVVLGLIARTVPQMNVLMVSFVLNIGFGLLVFVAVSDEFFHVAYRLYTEKLADWFLFVKP